MRGAYWECRSTLASEEIPEGFAFMHHIPIGLVSVRERTEFLEGWWLRLLQTYTAANLTYGKDRLPALAGIARSIFEERGGTYLAGLWYQPDPEADWQHQYDLRMQLCWSVANPRSRPQWRAPSWSWASVDGTIGFPKIFNTGGEILEDTYIDLSKAEMAYLGDDPFGGLSSGTLHFTCPSLLRGTRVGERSIRVSGRDGHNDQLFSFKPDYLSEESTFDSGKEVFLLPIFGGRTGYVTWAEGHLGDYDFAISVFGLFGLILERLEGESALFRRTGSFSFENEASLWSRADKNVSRESFLNVFAKRGHGDAEAAGAGIVDNEKYPEQRYMISIV